MNDVLRFSQPSPFRFWQFSQSDTVRPIREAASCPPALCEKCQRGFIVLHNAKYTSAAGLWGRIGNDVHLHNITVEKCMCGEDPIIPKLGMLVELVQQKAVDDFYWLASDQKWTVRAKTD